MFVNEPFRNYSSVNLSQKQACNISIEDETMHQKVVFIKLQLQPISNHILLKAIFETPSVQPQSL